MGAPLASVMADIFMAHLETTLMDELTSIGVCEWHRYVDDTFVRVQPGTNGFHPWIKLTYELKANSSLPFLDVRVTRSLERHTFEMDHLQEAHLHWSDDQLGFLRSSPAQESQHRQHGPSSPLHLLNLPIVSRRIR